MSKYVPARSRGPATPVGQPERPTFRQPLLLRAGVVAGINKGLWRLDGRHDERVIQ